MAIIAHLTIKEQHRTKPRAYFAPALVWLLAYNQSIIYTFGSPAL